MKREGVSPDYPEVYCWLGLLRTHTTRTPLPDAVAAKPTPEQIADVKQRIGEGKPAPRDSRSGEPDVALHVA